MPAPQILPLDLAVEKLYSVFQNYRPGKMHTSPVGDREAVAEELHRHTLRSAPVKLLGFYGFSAISTMGDENDFRHYLPRLFEVLVHDDFGYPVETVLGKLPYAKWRSWPEKEQAAITEWMYAWFHYDIRYSPWKAVAYLPVLAELAGSAKPFLMNWLNDLDDQSLPLLAEFCTAENFEQLKDCTYAGSLAYDEAKQLLLDAGFDKKFEAEFFRDPSGKHAELFSRAQQYMEQLRSGIY